MSFVSLTAETWSSILCFTYQYVLLRSASPVNFVLDSDPIACFNMKSSLLSNQMHLFLRQMSNSLSCEHSFQLCHSPSSVYSTWNAVTKRWNTLRNVPARIPRITFVTYKSKRVSSDKTRLISWILSFSSQRYLPFHFTIFGPLINSANIDFHVVSLLS